MGWISYDWVIVGLFIPNEIPGRYLIITNSTLGKYHWFIVLKLENSSLRLNLV